MTSGFWITIFIPTILIIFVIWEFVQLARRRAGNKSARTMSQYVIFWINQESKAARRFGFWFPIFIFFVGVWLFLHWEQPCFRWGVWCDLDI